MPNMEVPVLIQIGSEEREIVARVRYDYRPGTPAHYGSPTYSGHPAEGPEINVRDVISAPVLYTAAVREMVANYIAEHHEDEGPDADDLRDARIDRELMEG